MLNLSWGVFANAKFKFACCIRTWNSKLSCIAWIEQALESDDLEHDVACLPSAKQWEWNRNITDDSGILNWLFGICGQLLC